MLLFFLKTSALDSRTEAELMRNVNNILAEKSRTSIFIAHRWDSHNNIQDNTPSLNNQLFYRLRTVVEAGKLSSPRSFRSLLTISSCTDLILVINEGHIVEQGTHEELLRKAGLYYDMWLQQASDSLSSDSESAESVGDERSYDVEADEATVEHQDGTSAGRAEVKNGTSKTSEQR